MTNAEILKRINCKRKLVGVIRKNKATSIGQIVRKDTTDINNKRNDWRDQRKRNIRLRI